MNRDARKNRSSIQCRLFACVCVETEQAVVVYHKDSNAEMPIDELVCKHVLPGSLITHKGYARYGNLPNLKSGNGRNMYEFHQPQEYLSKLEFCLRM